VAAQRYRIYESGFGSYADVMWDDAANTADRIFLHVDASEPFSLTFSGAIAGTDIAETYPPSTDTTWMFPASIPVTFGVSRRGETTTLFGGVSSFAVSS
jgi:hypothetical protein